MAKIIHILSKWRQLWETLSKSYCHVPKSGPSIGHILGPKIPLFQPGNSCVASLPESSCILSRAALQLTAATVHATIPPKAYH